MHIKDETGDHLFDTPGIHKVGDKFGFNFHNAPNHYAVFTVIETDGDWAVVCNPRLVIKNSVSNEGLDQAPADTPIPQNLL